MTPWFKTLGALGRAPARLTGAYSQYIWLTLRYLMTILHACVHLSACLSPNLPAYSLYLKKKKSLVKPNSALYWLVQQFFSALKPQIPIWPESRSGLPQQH